MEGEAHSYRKLIALIMASVSIKRPRPCQNDIDDDLATPNFVFSGNDTFPRFLVIQSQDGSNPVTSSSPFIIEKQIESLIGTPKSVKKLKNKTLLVETNRKSQTENLLKVTSFFNLKVSVSQHNSLNSSKGIICDRMLKGESEDSIVEYLRPQGVTGCKRFKIKKEGQSVETKTLLLTFDRVNVPKSLKYFIVSFRLTCMYRILCAVLTARSSDITKPTVLWTPNLYAKTVERMAMPIIPVSVKILPNVSNAVRTTLQNQIFVKYG